MNAGIITIFDLSSIGNRLQNYAVTHTLQQAGLSCETLVPFTASKSEARLEKEEVVRELLDTDPVRAQTEYPALCRAIRSELFNQRFIPFRIAPHRQYGSEIEKDYDFFVTGSDQVWNPIFRSATGQIHNRLLAFAPPEKRVCFAPSIGLHELPASWHEDFIREWKRYPRLSIREKSGADLIRELTGRNAEVVLDPALMLSRQEWFRLRKPLPGFDPGEGYILYYLLGDPEKEIPPGLLEALRRDASERNLRHVRLFDREDAVIRSAGPQEILDLIACASMVCTDSYHGTIFSVLFGKPFILVNRKLEMRQMSLDMSSRFTTLLDSLGLSGHPAFSHTSDYYDLRNCDDFPVYEALQRERVKSARFLRLSLGLYN